ncbi:hypothetical protein GQX73_g5898 [Xylaria multiplex]|uniref:Uncharacterized protein n=1 Tax=Xylaria multiplex TaxID=323545 RepID=A0A7C8IMR9_9PEZI|nr:hypothetical protein GQX73_g5898 [Xylaria multiplex]
MCFYEYEFWQCGHITKSDDGSRVSSNGDLSQPPLRHVPRDLIEKKLGDMCPRCCADLKIAEKRVKALTDFLSRHPGSTFMTNNNIFVNYPPEFLRMSAYVLDLEAEVFQAAIDDFSVTQKRLKPRFALRFLGVIRQVRENALYCFKGGNEATRQCLVEIVKEANHMIREIEEHDRAELELLAGLDAKAARLLDHLRDWHQKAEAQREALQKPKL